MHTHRSIFSSSKHFSSKNISCRQSMSRAFTLIEVMVAVVIISIVISALLQMHGNSSNLFSKVKRESNIGQYASLLIASKDYGFENKRITLDKLTDSFELDSSLRSQLKNQKAEIIYTELEAIDMSEFDGEHAEESEELVNLEKEKEVSSAFVFEIGKSTLKFENSSTSLLRLRIQ